MNKRFLSISLLTLAATCVQSPAFAHGNDGANLPPSDFAHLNPRTILQLADVVTATARFQDIDQALAEGYVDIGVFVPHMGHHYMKQDLLDARFDPEQPELLVYADDPCGGALQLVAVEYAVPFEDSKDAPRGFPGSADVWDHTDAFGIWTLHAWVWKFNPSGEFAPLNPQVP